MKSEMVMENIEPFCEVWYKNCFYTLLFIVVKHFNKDVKDLLVNDVLLYKYDGSRLSLIEKSEKPIEKIMDDIGIAYERLSSEGNAIYGFMDFLSKGGPVIVWQDLYYASFREDFYLRSHWLHTVLLYGYNSIGQYFNIIEQNFRDSYFYKKTKATFLDIQNSNEGAFMNFPGMEISNMGFYIKEPSEKVKTESEAHTYQVKYMQNFLKNKEEIKESFNNIKNAIQDFKNIISDETELCKSVDEIIDQINQIISFKNADLYKYIKVFGEQTGLRLTLLKSIISEWEVIRAILVKYKHSLIYRAQSLNSTINRMTNIYQLEQEFFSEFDEFIRSLEVVKNE